MTIVETKPTRLSINHQNKPNSKGRSLDIIQKILSGLLFVDSNIFGEEKLSHSSANQVRLI